MATDKYSHFEMSRQSGRITTGVLAAYLLLELLVEAGDFIGLARVSQGPLVYGISRITQTGVGHVFLTLATTGTLRCLWDRLRRALKDVKSVLWYVVLALMALMVCDMLLMLPPETSSLMDSIQHPTRFTTFANHFRSVSSGLQTLLRLGLSISLIVKYRGRILAYGCSDIVCTVLSAVGMGAFYSYLVTSGVSFLSGALSFGVVLFRYALGVIPIIFMRRTMVYTHVRNADAEGDI